MCKDDRSILTEADNLVFLFPLMAPMRVQIVLLHWFGCTLPSSSSQAENTKLARSKEKVYVLKVNFVENVSWYIF